MTFLNMDVLQIKCPFYCVFPCIYRACVIYLDKVVDSLKVCQVVIGHVHTNTKVQTSITPVNDLEVPEL